MVEINIEVDETARRRLQALFGAGTDLDRILKIVLQAGAQEALDYATGAAVFSSMADLRSYRVFCLLRAGMTPDDAEQVLPALFKLSPAGTRRIVATSFARYSIELADTIETVLRSTLDAATWVKDDSRWKVSLPAGLARDRVLELTRNSDQPDPVRQTGAVHAFPDETYQWLRGRLNFDERPVPK